MPRGGRGRGRFKQSILVGEIDTDAPAAPTNLVDTAKTTTSITLGWDANSESDLAGYRVYNSLDGINFSPIITLTSTPAYLVLNDLNSDPLTPNTPYYFYVTAVDKSNNESEPSNTDQTTTSVPEGDLAPPGPVGGEQGNWHYMPTASWRATADIVNGWDFAISPSATVEEWSGLFHDFGFSAPPGYAGNKLYQYNARWADLEASENDYTGITAMLADFDDILSGTGGFSQHDGIFLQVRGLVHFNPIIQKTGPAWVKANYPAIPLVTHGNGMQEYDMTDATIQGLYSDFLGQVVPALDTYMTANPGLKFILVKGVSSSLGEEWSGQGSNSAVQAYWENTVWPAWQSNTSAANRHRLMWLRADYGNESNFTAWDTTAVANSWGFRPNGSIESWLFNWFHRGGTQGSSKYHEVTGQRHDDDGYLITDENHLCVATQNNSGPARGWQEQNERGYPSKPNQEFHHFMASMRCLQIRFNHIWEPSTSWMNRPMVNWMGYELGHGYDTAHSAWILLHRSWARSATTQSAGWNDRAVNNFERWLYQRESETPTTAVLQQNWDTPFLSISNIQSTQTSNPNLPGPFTLRGRQAASIGIAIDPLFMSGSSNSVAIKVTYLDNDAGSWDLRWTDSAAQTQTQTVVLGNDNMVRTATVFISDLAATQTGTTPDFYLDTSDTVPFMFVQVIKV